MAKLYHDKEWLVEQYCEKGLGLPALAKEAECTTTSIRYWMDKLGIPRRSISAAHATFYNFDPVCRDRNWLHEQYWDNGLTLREIADKAGCSPRAIRDWMNEFGIPRRAKGKAKGSPSPSFRLSDEHKRKISIAAKKRWANEAFRQRMAESSRVASQARSLSMKKAHQRGCYDGVFVSPTGIEIEVAAALDSFGVEHQTQYRPEGHGRTYDEFISPNVFIEVQGDYWHGWPEKWPEPNEMQQKNIKGDARKRRWAAEHGYELVALWEHEIHKHGALALVAERVLPLIDLDAEWYEQLEMELAS